MVAHSKEELHRQIKRSLRSRSDSGYLIETLERMSDSEFTKCSELSFRPIVDEDIDAYIDYLISNHRNNWSRVCEAHASLKIEASDRK